MICFLTFLLKLAFNDSMAGGFGGAGGFTNDGEITDSPSTAKKTGVFGFVALLLSKTEEMFFRPFADYKISFPWCFAC